MYCKALYDAVEKRLEKKMSIDQIATEVCPDISKPRDKVIALIRGIHDNGWLIQNADWLGFTKNNSRYNRRDTEQVEEHRKKTNAVIVRTAETKDVSADTIADWKQRITKAHNILSSVNGEMTDTTYGIKFGRSLKRINKRLIEICQKI